MELGVCSAEVKRLQKDMNAFFGTKRVEESGTFEEGTEHYLKLIQKKLGVKETGKGDKTTLRALNYALMPRTEIEINGKKAFVTSLELHALQQAAYARAAKDLQKFVVMAKEAEGYWNFHKQMKDNNWFSGIVDSYAGAKFPPKSEIDAAKKAATSMVTDALSGKDFNVKRRSEPIRKALKNIQTYRNKLYDGGDDLIKKLEIVRDTSEISVQIMAAVATGGASWYVQVGVSASVGAYKGVMGELRKAKDAKVTFNDISKSAMKNAVIEGTVGLIMKGGGKGVGGFADDVAEAAVKKVGTGTAKQAVKSYAIRFANGAGQKTVEDTLKLYVETKLDPKKKVTRDDLIKIAAGSVVSGGLKSVGPVADKYAKKASKQFDASDFLEVSDKARQADMWKGGLEKAVESAGEGAVDRVLKTWGPKKNANLLEKEIRKQIKSDRKVLKVVKKIEREAA